MSKKEIRRAARDAFPKAKGAPAKRRSGSKGGRPASTGSTARSNVPKPPSLKRSITIGAITAFAFFALIEWVFNLGETGTYGNVVFAGAAFILYSGLNYFMERLKYRRYLKKSNDSGK